MISHWQRSSQTRRKATFIVKASMQDPTCYISNSISKNEGVHSETQPLAHMTSHDPGVGDHSKEYRPDSILLFKGFDTFALEQTARLRSRPANRCHPVPPEHVFPGLLSRKSTVSHGARSFPSPSPKTRITHRSLNHSSSFFVELPLFPPRRPNPATQISTSPTAEEGPTATQEVVV